MRIDTKAIITDIKISHPIKYKNGFMKDARITLELPSLRKVVNYSGYILEIDGATKYFGEIADLGKLFNKEVGTQVEVSIESVVPLKLKYQGK